MWPSTILNLHHRDNVFYKDNTRKVGAPRPFPRSNIQFDAKLEAAVAVKGAVGRVCVRIQLEQHKRITNQ